MSRDLQGKLLPVDIWLEEQIETRTRLIRDKKRNIERIQREIDEITIEIEFYEEELGRYNSGK